MDSVDALHVAYTMLKDFLWLIVEKRLGLIICTDVSIFVYMFLFLATSGVVFRGLLVDLAWLWRPYVVSGFQEGSNLYMASSLDPVLSPVQ